MTKVPEGYTELELVGFTDKGNYADGTHYVKNDLVHYGGSIYKCIVDDTVDVLPNNTSCWEVFIPNHSNLDSIMAVDTEGKLGAKGEEVSAQQLVDKISRDTNKMVGATSETDGSIGLVPPPRAGDEDKALLGNGTWGKVDSIYKYKTEEEYNQAVANNEIPDGATVIKEWDEELSVIPVDSELSEESLNPLQNKVIAQKITELNRSIEELNGLLGGKLDVSKIANNLVTTEAGYALDARMGKELSDRVVSVDNLIKNAPFSMIHELQATATFEGHKAHISFSFNDTMTGLVIITGRLDDTNTYFCTILCVGTRYTDVNVVYSSGANLVGTSLENDNTICVESNVTPTGLGTVKVTHIGSFG